MPRKNFVIFDFDGTLIDFHCDWRGLYKKLDRFFASRGVTYNHDLGISDNLSVARKMLGKRSGGAGFFRREMFEIVRKQEKEFLLNRAIPKPYARALLSSLSIPFAVLTNNHSKTVAMAFEKFKFKSPKIIIGIDKVKNGKPDPEGAITILKKTGFFPEETCLVGDSSDDILAGQAAGIATSRVGPKTTLKKVQSFINVQK